MKNAAIFLSLLISVSCSKSDSDSPQQDNESTPVVTELEGTWKKACTDIVGYKNTEISTFAGTNFERTVENLQTCQGDSPSPLSKTVYTGTFELGAELANPVGSKAINFVYTKIQHAPMRDNEADAYNSAQYCGETGWINGVLKDVTGKTCGGTTFSSGYIEYNVYKLSNNEFSKGDVSAVVDRNGTTADKRPTDFLFARFVRQ